jgi:hypothetical protein
VRLGPLELVQIEVPRTAIDVKRIDPVVVAAECNLVLDLSKIGTELPSEIERREVIFNAATVRRAVLVVQRFEALLVGRRDGHEASSGSDAERLQRLQELRKAPKSFKVLVRNSIGIEVHYIVSDGSDRIELLHERRPVYGQLRLSPLVVVF